MSFILSLLAITAQQLSDSAALARWREALQRQPPELVADDMVAILALALALAFFMKETFPKPANA